MAGLDAVRDQRLQRSSDVLESEVNGEVVALSIDAGMCYGFNQVGTRVWQLLAEPMTLDELCARLTNEFDVPEDVCRAEVSRLLADLYDERLIRAA